MSEKSENSKILVIDDNAEILEIISIVLSDKGYEIIPSSTTNILNNIGAIKPDLILLDNFVGQESGSDICKKLKADSLFSHIPVILCSATDDLKKLAEQCDADNFLVKPFNLDSLEDIVSQALAK